MTCPACNSLRLNVDYRVAFPKDGAHWYRASCNDCGAALNVEAERSDVAKMVVLAAAASPLPKENG